MKKVNLPYVDRFLKSINEGNESISEAFGEHMHLGFWDCPSSISNSVDPSKYNDACKNLCSEIFKNVSIFPGSVIADIGCGFGGTVHYLNSNFDEITIFGLNIDSRQLARAKQRVFSDSSNQIAFIEGDACNLPFENNSIDILLSLESIFHFGDRKKFFIEAQRVLKYGGHLCIVDFVPNELLKNILSVISKITPKVLSISHGGIDITYTFRDYIELSNYAGMKLTSSLDYSENTLPSYDIINSIKLSNGLISNRFIDSISLLGKAQKYGLLKYFYLIFCKL
jgi:SAM-dependent methyltransferase